VIGVPIKEEGLRNSETHRHRRERQTEGQVSMEVETEDCSHKPKNI
jgi:hypothetical protein